MFEVDKVIINVFERRLLCSTSLQIFDQKYCKKSNTEKYLK